MLPTFIFTKKMLKYFSNSACFCFKLITLPGTPLPSKCLWQWNEGFSDQTGNRKAGITVGMSFSSKTASKGISSKHLWVPSVSVAVHRMWLTVNFERALGPRGSQKKHPTVHRALLAGEKILRAGPVFFFFFAPRLPLHLYTSVDLARNKRVSLRNWGVLA